MPHVGTTITDHGRVKTARLILESDWFAAVEKERDDWIRRWSDMEAAAHQERNRAEVAEKKVAAVALWIDEAPEQTAGLDLLRQIIADRAATEDAP